MGNNLTENREAVAEPVKVKNKDILLLADVLPIMQEICALEEHRDWQHDRMSNITQHLTWTPGAHGPGRGMDDAFAMLSEIDEEHEDKCKQYARLMKKAQKILNGIESHSMRTFVLMKYVMDRPDTEIRDELNMGRRGFDRARRSIEEADNMASVKWKEKYILVKD